MAFTSFLYTLCTANVYVCVTTAKKKLLSNSAFTETANLVFNDV